jgi:hypothetical protein
MPGLRHALAFLVVAGLAVAVAGMAACASSGSGAAASAPVARVVDDRPLVTAGARCQGGACRCRQTDDNGYTVGEGDASSAAGQDTPAAGTKRFELRTGRGNDDVQVTVEGAGTLHKSSDTVEPSCGYIDLAPGEHRVHLRVKAPAGEVAAPRLFIYEHGESTGSWYGSFAMSCGTGATCTRPELEDSMAALKHPRGIFDPCGSAKVTSMRYDAQRDAQDRVTGLDLDVVLHVEKFEPRFPRGGRCKGPSPATE